MDIGACLTKVGRQSQHAPDFRRPLGEWNAILLAALRNAARANCTPGTEKCGGGFLVSEPFHPLLHLRRLFCSQYQLFFCCMIGLGFRDGAGAEGEFVGKYKSL